MKNKKIVVVLLLISLYVQVFSLPINVSIIGHTDNPGVYLLDSSNRVSQAISYIEKGSIKDLDLEGVEEEELSEKEMEGFKLQPDSQYDNTKKLAILNKQKKEKDSTTDISYRKIILIREGQTQEINLQNFFLYGDFSDNPYLKNDDVIKLLPTEYQVELLGEVNREGLYEFVKGEKISDVIEYGLGFTANADLSNIRINRLLEDTGELQSWTIDYSLISENPNSSNNIELQHNDVIKVSKKSYLYNKKEVQVIGLVKYPGDYSIDDKSTLLSVLEKAGGPLPTADLSFAMLIDEASFSGYDPDLERLLSLNITTMTVTEYSYYQTKLREISGKHYINIDKLWETKDNKLDRPVKNGDIIFIREPQMLVNISGAVQHAGLQPWSANKTWKEYIDDAGGLIPTAYESKIRVIRYDTNVWVKIKKDAVINPGDEIFVPEKQEKLFWEYFTEGLAITAQLITIVLGVHTLTQ